MYMKTTIVFMVVFLAAVFSAAASTITLGITYVKDGSLTSPDSARVDIVYQPSGSTTTYDLLPDSAIWDTSITITGNTDEYATIKYTIFSGDDTAYARDIERIRYDTSSFNEVYWGELADRADSGSIATAGFYVWSYGTKEVTLTSAEKTTLTEQFRAEIERDEGFLWDLVYYWGACDSCKTIYYPEDGTSPKDSAVVYSANGTAKKRVVFRHSNNNAVADSSEVSNR